MQVQTWVHSYTCVPSMLVLSERWLLVWRTVQVTYRLQCNICVSILNDYESYSVISATRYFHVLLPQVGPAFHGRRGSVPAPFPSSVSHFSERRGSEPGLWRGNVPSRHRCSGSQSAIHALNPCQDTGHLPGYIVEERLQGTGGLYNKPFVNICIVLLYCTVPEFLLAENDVESAQSSGVAEARHGIHEVCIWIKFSKWGIFCAVELWRLNQWWASKFSFICAIRDPLNLKHKTELQQLAVKILRWQWLSCRAKM